MNSHVNGLSAKLKGRRLWSTLLVLITLTLGILIGTVAQKGALGKDKATGASDATPLTLPAPQQMSSAFSKVAKQLEPTVVNINTESTIKPSQRRRRGATPDDSDSMQDFFDRFFGGDGGQLGPGSPEGARQRSLGSGVIVDPKGYIVTNAHVVEKADRIRVSLPDDAPGQQYDAKVIGVDKETDLAVIKIEPRSSSMRPSSGTPIHSTLATGFSPSVAPLVLSTRSPRVSSPPKGATSITANSSNRSCKPTRLLIRETPAVRW